MELLSHPFRSNSDYEARRTFILFLNSEGKTWPEIAEQVYEDLAQNPTPTMKCIAIDVFASALRLTECFSMCQSLLEDLPNDPRVLRILILISAKRGDSTNAEFYYNKLKGLSVSTSLLLTCKLVVYLVSNAPVEVIKEALVTALAIEVRDELFPEVALQAAFRVKSPRLILESLQLHASEPVLARGQMNRVKEILIEKFLVAIRSGLAGQRE